MPINEEKILDGGHLVPISNTRIADIQYGKKITIKQFGRVMTRNYNETYCETCGDKITAYYVVNRAYKHGIALISSTKFNQLKYCKKPTCGVKHKRRIQSITKKNRYALSVPLSHREYIVEKFLGLAHE